MANWIQHLLVLLLVIGCVAVIARQFVRTFSFKGGKLGSCCNKGCDAGKATSPDKRVAFLPVEMLGRKR